MRTKTRPLQFKAEARQLLQLLIHSVYSNRDVFLRELVSNAADALDKLRMESYRDKDLQADTSDLHIAIEADPEERTLTVRDNGIGMTRDEVVALIGTLARSGADDFLSKIRESGGAVTEHLIGQFGVGFYSSFMVADRIILVTRRAGETGGTRWESGGENYTLEEVADAPQGTSVTLQLKAPDPEDNLFDYTAGWKLRQIVRQYSDFVPWPIRMAAEAASDDVTEGGSDDDGEAEPTESAESGTVSEMETINSRKATWSLSPQEVTEDEYHDLYRRVSGDWYQPLHTIHVKAEGTHEFHAILYIPSQSPLDMFARSKPPGIELYVRRVHLMDGYTELMPNYLRFVTGVVDAQDLPLNVARESLQQDRQIHLIRRYLVRRILATVKDLMTQDPERYHAFWRDYGRAVKEGLLSDPDNREALLQICTFDTASDGVGPTTLSDYVSRMKPDQEHIYYLTGESRAKIESSPHLEAFRAKGYEALVLTDPLDELWVNQVGEFDGKPFQSIAQGELDLDGDDDEDGGGEADRERQREELVDLLGWLTKQLSSNVRETRISQRLTHSAACLVGDADEMSPTMEKRLRAMGQDVPAVSRVLEVNADHPLIKSMQAAVKSDPEDPDLGELAELVYGAALLAEGGELADPARFSQLLTDRLAATLLG